jgi:hypothetical protein
MIFLCLQGQAQQQIIRLSHHINTTASEYYPVVNKDWSRIYFTGMDRTGFFDFKIDFTTAPSSGGEDIFYAEAENGLWKDARDLKGLNTKGHESVTDVLADETLVLTANYPENLGPSNSDKGAATTDLFLAKKRNDGFQIIHFDEPVNSIYSEFDGEMDDKQSYILFVSDRPGHQGPYHKKGWQWNSGTWGNTDIWVSLKVGTTWGIPVNLGPKVNTSFTERTPWLSPDGKKLFISSNGHNNRADLDIFYFTRKNLNEWTNWEGPFPVKDVNSTEDDWCYRETGKIAYFARAIKLGYPPTNRYRNGAGTPFENNFREGYRITGQQSASLKAEEQTELMMLVPTGLPLMKFEFPGTFPDHAQLSATLERLEDLISINAPKVVRLSGFVSKENHETMDSFLKSTSERLRTSFGSDKQILSSIKPSSEDSIEISFEF